MHHIKEKRDDRKQYKERLVVNGFQQKEGINYNEIFCPGVKLTTIRTVLALVARDDLYLEQMDVKIAFLHGDVEEEIYICNHKGLR